VDSTFPRARKPHLGYNIEQVEEFLQVARRAYDGTARPGDPPLSAERIRLAAFAMQKRGYSTAHVDAALERLEDAFAAEERQVAARLHGTEAWLAEARTTAQVITNRLARPEGERFDRVSPLALGYRVRPDVLLYASYSDIFEPQDKITESVVGAVEPSIRLEEINDGFEAMKGGEVARSVIVFDN